MNIALYFVILLAFVITFTLEVIRPASGATCNKRWQIYAGALSFVQIGTKDYTWIDCHDLKFVFIFELFLQIPRSFFS